MAIGLISLASAAYAVPTLNSAIAQFRGEENGSLSDILDIDLVIAHMAASRNGAIIVLVLLLPAVAGGWARKPWGHLMALVACWGYLVAKAGAWAQGWGPMMLVVYLPAFFFILNRASSDGWRQHYGMPSKGCNKWRSITCAMIWISIVSLMIFTALAISASTTDRSLDWREFGATYKPRTELMRGSSELLERAIR